MLLYLQFNGRFSQKADRLARIFACDHGFDRFRGISTSEGHTQWLARPKNTPIRYEHVQPLPELWRRAIRRGKPTSPATIDRLESDYGPIWPLLMGDRNIGYTFLPDVILPKTDLRTATAKLGGALSCIEEILTYYEREFSENRPDLVLFHNVSAGPAICAAAVCRKMGIPFLTLGMTQVDTRHHVSTNIYMAPDEAIARFADPATEISDYARKWVEKCVGKPVPTEPDKAFRKIMANRFKGSWAQLAIQSIRTLPAALKPWRKPYLPDPRVASAAEQWRHELRSQLNYRRNFRSGLFSDGPFTGDYVYFAMSWTPEMSTLIVAPTYANQLTVIQALAQQIPAGWKLVVKDHTFMPATRRQWFYETISKLQSVVIASPDCISAQLAANARVMATISGTAGWESIIAKTPTIVFSDIWYLATGLAVRCRELDKLSHDIRRAIDLAENTSPDKHRERIARMVQALIDGSIPFDDKLMWRAVTKDDLDNYERDLSAMAAKVMRRLAEARSAPVDPFDSTPWNHDRFPSA